MYTQPLHIRKECLSNAETMGGVIFHLHVYAQPLHIRKEYSPNAEIMAGVILHVCTTLAHTERMLTY